MEKQEVKGMKQRKIAAFLLTVCVAAAAAGCGSKEISNKYVEISQYKGVEAEKVTEEELTDEEVDNYINSVRGENREKVTDRALKQGDLAEFEYTGKLGKEVFDEGTLTLGNGETYVAGFEEGIYGHKIGETFELPITFPEGYGGEQKPELSGADVVFTIKITSITNGELPKLDDKFVKNVSKESKTVAEYKKEVKKILKESKEKTAKTALADNAWKSVMDNVKVNKYPEDRVKELKKQLKDQMEMMLQYYGTTYKDYLEQSGMTEKESDEQMEESAKEYLKNVMAAELIAEKEGIKFSDKEYKDIMKDYAEEYGYESVDAMIAQVGESQVKEVILQDKVKEFVAEKCKQVEPKKEDTKDTKDKDTEEKDAEEKDTKDKDAKDKDTKDKK